MVWASGENGRQEIGSGYYQGQREVEKSCKNLIDGESPTEERIRRGMNLQNLS